MSITIKNLLEQLLQCEGASSAKPVVDALVARLCGITHLDLHPDFFQDEGASITARGKAVSPTTAAQCAEDIERTRVFIQGINQLINDKLREKHPLAPVEILYAGTGPFGLLLVPLLTQFEGANLRVSLLDIHQDSLDKLRLVINRLELHGLVAQMVCADACSWKSNKKFDVIISETMKQGLVQEPQLSLFAHLQQFLADDGVLIPEKICLDLWLAKAGSRQLAAEQNQELHLGRIFQLDLPGARQLGAGDLSALRGSVMVPDYSLPLSDLKLTTTIQVYREHRLAEYQSQLTLPIYEKNACPKPQTELFFHYELGPYPEFVFNYCKQAAVASEPLPQILEANRYGIYHLKRMWHKAQKQKLGGVPAADLLPQEWLLDRMVLDRLGAGLEPGMEQLYHSSEFSQFEDWLLATAGGVIAQAQVMEINQAVTNFIQRDYQDCGPQEPVVVLTDEQLEFWDANGYIVIPGVLSNGEAKAARDAIWQFLEMQEHNSCTWYSNPVSMKNIMVQLFSHPALDVARNSSKLKAIFTQLWGHGDLVMTTDRVGFNPPETASWHFPGPHMHWDVALVPPIPFGTQGLIYLTDTAENQGAFSCVPGFHKRIDQWLAGLAEGVDPAQQDWSNWPVKPITANAGDLIIWHQALPHGSSPNRAQSPRMVQYINMYR